MACPPDSILRHRGAGSEVWGEGRIWLRLFWRMGYGERKIFDVGVNWQPAVQRRRQLFHADWLHQYVVHPAGETMIEGVSAGFRCHGDNRGVAVRRFAPAN